MILIFTHSSLQIEWYEIKKQRYEVKDKAWKYQVDHEIEWLSFKSHIEKVINIFCLVEPPGSTSYERNTNILKTPNRIFFVIRCCN